LTQGLVASVVELLELPRVGNPWLKALHQVACNEKLTQIRVYGLRESAELTGDVFSILAQEEGFGLFLDPTTCAVLGGSPH